MEEKRGRKGNDDDDDDDDEFEKAAVAKLFKLIAEDGRSDILRYQVRIIKKLRKSLPPQQTNPKLERAEGELFQLIEDRRSLSDIEIKAGIVQGLKAELAIGKFSLLLVSARFSNLPSSSYIGSGQRHPRTQQAEQTRPWLRTGSHGSFCSSRSG